MLDTLHKLKETISIALFYIALPTMDMYTDVIIIVAALSVWLRQRENQVCSLLLLPSYGYHSKLLQGTVHSVNADANEDICSFEEQERLSGMSCHENITNETKETHIRKQEDEANPGKEAEGVTRL